MISRREFFQATAAACALFAGSGLGSLGRLAAQQKLSQADILRFDPLGTVTILHVTDIHAHLKPVYYREPSVNLGVGSERGRPPHLTDKAFRDYFKVAAGTADQYALTSEDFVQLARNYGKMGGMDRIATLIKAVRAERGEDKVLLLDGGDTWQGSWTALKTEAADMVEVMEALKTDAMASHWEFTLGEKRVKDIVEKSPIAFLAQNIRSKEWQEEVFKGTKIFEKGGVKIAVIGQAMPRTAIANPNWMFPDWEFGLREDDMQKQVDQARAAGAAIVVLLSHNGVDTDKKMVSRVKGIDVCLTAHTHDAMPGVLQIGDTVVIASGSHGKFVSRLDIEVKDRRVSAIRFKLMPVFSDAIAPDAAMSGLIDKWRKPYEADLSRVVGHTESLLYRRGSFNGTFDDLICQSMLTERDAEISISPGFRWGPNLIPGDPITFEAITNASAMTYPACYRTEMSGDQLKLILEDVADNIFHPDPYFQGGGDMVRVGGLGYTIDVSKPVNQRISDLLHLKSGQPIEAGKKYVVSGWASVNKDTQGPPIWEVIEKYVARVKTVNLKENTAVIVKGA